MESARKKQQEQFYVEKIDYLIKFFTNKRNLHEDGDSVRYSILGGDLGYVDIYLQEDKEKFLNNNPGDQIFSLVDFLNENKFNIRQENYRTSKQTLMDLSDKEVCYFASSNKIVSIIQDLKNIRSSIAVGDEINKITFIYNSEENIDESELNKDDIVKFCINNDYLNECRLTTTKMVPIISLIDLCLKKRQTVNIDVKNALNSGRGRIYINGSYKKTDLIVTERGKNILSDKVSFEFICSSELNSRKRKI